MRYPAQIALLAMLVPTLVWGVDQAVQNEERTPQSHSPVEMLSQDLRDLLSREMQAVQSGMMSIIPAYASGNWEEIAAIAGKIKHSYILAQGLTDAQAEELHSVLPTEFITQDEHFHYLAGMLEHAADNEKSELVNFYFSEMTESCVTCHAAFATHKFPGLVTEKEADHTH